MNHQPLTLEIEEDENKTQNVKQPKEEEEESNRPKKTICWSEDAKKLYKERTEERKEGEDQDIDSVNRK